MAQVAQQDTVREVRGPDMAKGVQDMEARDTGAPREAPRDTGEKGAME
jgi:hypothetical protein